jgi:mRNA-degrading endonuclease RelE of RelBE toxin-antitoxin system
VTRQLGHGEGWRVEIARPAIAGLRSDTPVGDVRRLADISPPEWRLRVGDWRVRFTRDAATRTVLILRVLHRASAYRG